MQLERRAKDRLDYTLPLKVRGSEPEGKAYRFETVARNIGAGGLCAYSTRMMRLGEWLSLRVRFACPGGKMVQAPEVSMRGRVVRVDERADGLCMFAVSFLKIREA